MAIPLTFQAASQQGWDLRSQSQETGNGSYQSFRPGPSNWHGLSHAIDQAIREQTPGVIYHTSQLESCQELVDHSTTCIPSSKT